MKPCKLFVRCFARVKDGQWQAFCIDFDLAAQGDSFEDVRAKLEDQIVEYVNDALVGEDREHAAYLMTRKAPLSLRLAYHLGGLFHSFSKTKDGICRAFMEPLPLTVSRVHA